MRCVVKRLLRSLRIHLQYSSLGLARNAWQLSQHPKRALKLSSCGFKWLKNMVNIWLHMIYELTILTIFFNHINHSWIYEYCICLTWLIWLIHPAISCKWDHPIEHPKKRWFVWWAKESRWSTNFNRRLEVHQIGLPVLKLLVANGDSVPFEDSLI